MSTSMTEDAFLKSFGVPIESNGFCFFSLVLQCFELPCISASMRSVGMHPFDHDELGYILKAIIILLKAIKFYIVLIDIKLQKLHSSACLWQGV